MDDTGISARVIEEIRQLAEKYSIEQVLLFGSRARGDYRRTSDIDLAVRGAQVYCFILNNHFIFNIIFLPFFCSHRKIFIYNKCAV